MLNTNIASPEHKADPFPFYARLRQESPVHRVTLPDKRSVWIITRYRDVAAALKDDRFAKDAANALDPGQMAKQPWMPGFIKPLMRNMLDVDDPDHHRLRALVSKAFTPGRVDEMKPRIERVTARLIESLRTKTAFDLIADFALPLPTTVIAEMLGVPAADHRKFTHWSNLLIASSESTWAKFRMIPGVWFFIRYIKRLVAARRKAPQDDLISALIQVEDEGKRFNEDELVAMIVLLLVAGHETTVNLIGNGMLEFLSRQEVWTDLRAKPDLIPSAVEEMLRFTSPVETATERYAREEVEYAGTRIGRGDVVFAAIASANRDESQFPDPDRLDIRRSPNRHLAFGNGEHYCLGAPLARLETQIALQTLVQRPRNLDLAVPRNRLPWKGGLVLRGMRSFPVRVSGWD